MASMSRGTRSRSRTRDGGSSRSEVTRLPGLDGASQRRAGARPAPRPACRCRRAPPASPQSGRPCRAPGRCWRSRGSPAASSNARPCPRRARGPSPRGTSARASSDAGSSAGTPNAAVRRGGAAARSGPRNWSTRLVGVTRQRREDAPVAGGVGAERRSRSSSTERSRSTAGPSSSGCASGACGCTNSTRCGVAAKSAKNRDEVPNGSTVAPTSWWKPGSVSSAVRQAPPTSSAGLDDVHGEPVLRQRDRGGEPVRTGADDDGVVASAHRGPQCSSAGSSPTVALIGPNSSPSSRGQ